MDLEDILNFEHMQEVSYSCNWKPKDFPQQNILPGRKTKCVHYIPFGKYKGWKITKVFKRDPQYINWILENVRNNDILLESIRTLTNTHKKISMIQKPFKAKTIIRKKQEQTIHEQDEHINSIMQENIS